MSKIFVEEPTTKPQIKEKKKRKPMSAEAKAALVKRLSDARAAKKKAKEEAQKPAITIESPPKVEVVQAVEPVQPKPKEKKTN